jgi:hypothetical protein
LLVVQEWRIAKRLAINKAAWSRSIEGQSPIADRLKLNATKLRSFGSRAAIIDHRQRQKPTRLARVRRPFWQLAQSIPS